MAVANSKKEMIEITKKSVKIESVCQQTQQAMQKLQVEHSVERKCQVKKIAMLEKVIADERQQRRELVQEASGLDEKRTDTLKKLEQKELEIRELKRQRLEKEEEADRARILLKDEQQRAQSLLTLSDKHHSAVASHNAEVRQMQVILEDERAQAKAQINELKTSYEVARSKLEQEIDSWQLRFEDALSLLHFNPMVEKIKKLEKDNEQLNQNAKTMTKKLETNETEIANLTADVEEKAAHIVQVETAHNALQVQHEKLGDDFEKAILNGEHSAMKLGETEARLLQIIDYVAAFDDEKSMLESKITALSEQVRSLEALLNVPKKDGACQAKPVYSTSDMNTDLSYQYLEDSDALQNGHGRKRRLDNLKNASDFIDASDAKRDFTSNMKTCQDVIHNVSFDSGPALRTDKALLHVTHMKSGQLRAGGELPQLVASPKKTPRVLNPMPPYASPKQNHGLQSSRRHNSSSLTPSPWADEGKRGGL